MYHIMYDGFNQFAGHFRAGSLNQGADTASLKKNGSGLPLVSRITRGSQLDSSHLALPVSI